MLPLALILVSFIFAVLSYIGYKWSYWHRQGIPNTGPFVQFLIGFGLTNRQSIDIEIEWYQKYGPVYGTYNLFKPILTLGGMEHAKNILIEDFSKFRHHTLPPGDLPEPMKKVVFSLRGEEWKKMRGIVLPAFSSLKLKFMLESIEPCIDEFLNQIKNVKQISIKNYFDALTADLIFTCAFGTKIHGLYEPNNQVVGQISRIVLGPGNATNNFSSVQFICQLILDLVIERKKENEILGCPRLDFLQILVNAKYFQNLKDEEICSLGIAFFVDGFQGISVLLTAFTYFLAKNNQVQNDLFKEIKSFSGSIDELTQLKYLDAAFKETTRLWPPGRRNERCAVGNYKLKGTNFTIPAGMTIEFPVCAMHRDPILFPNPAEFKPERFLAGGQNENLNPLTILTFGAGSRSCVGKRFATLAIKISIAKILKQIEFFPTPETKLENLTNNEDSMLLKDVFLRIVDREESKVKVEDPKLKNYYPIIRKLSIPGR